MKVLEEGKRKKWAIEVHCTGKGNGEEAGACGALLEVEANDIFSTSSSSYDGSSESYLTIECPQCKTFTDLSCGEIPGYIRDQAYQRKRYPNDRNRTDYNEK